MATELIFLHLKEKVTDLKRFNINLWVLNERCFAFQLIIILNLINRNIMVM